MAHGHLLFVLSLLCYSSAHLLEGGHLDNLEDNVNKGQQRFDVEINEKVAKEGTKNVHKKSMLSLLGKLGHWLHHPDKLHGDRDVQASRYQTRFYILLYSSSFKDLPFCCFKSKPEKTW